MARRFFSPSFFLCLKRLPSERNKRAQTPQHYPAMWCNRFSAPVCGQKKGKKTNWYRSRNNFGTPRPDVTNKINKLTPKGTKGGTRWANADEIQRKPTKSSRKDFFLSLFRALHYVFVAFWSLSENGQKFLWHVGLLSENWVEIRSFTFFSAKNDVNSEHSNGLDELRGRSTGERRDVLYAVGPGHGQDWVGHSGSEPGGGVSRHVRSGPEFGQVRLQPGPERAAFSDVPSFQVNLWLQHQ